MCVVMRSVPGCAATRLRPCRRSDKPMRFPLHPVFPMTTRQERCHDAEPWLSICMTAESRKSRPRAAAGRRPLRRVPTVPMITILIDGEPKFVVRPNDNKALFRFLRNANKFLVGDKADAAVSHRPSEPEELERWRAAYGLHQAWGGDDEQFFGIPLS